MPTNEMPAPGPNADGRKMSGPLCVGPADKDLTEIPALRDTSRMLDHTRPVSSSLEYSFVPEEIFRALTCASSSLSSPEYLKSHQTAKNTMGFRGCLQTPDRLWHYPNRRSKFRHLTDHPVSLTGAGRDVSYLCDVVTRQEDRKTMAHKSSFSESHQEQRQSSHTVPSSPQATLAHSLVPKEFHIVKNRGVLPLKYFDDKYTTLLEDHKKKLRLFPSMKPAGRFEVIQLMEAMDNMLEKAGVDELIRVTGPSQLHNVLELLKAEQNIYNIVFHELIRQVSVDCVERGQLLSKLRQRYVDLLKRIPQQMKTLYKKMMAQRLIDRHITEELLYFKESVEQLTSELYEVREHDRKATREAEKAQEELAAAMQEAEANANLLEQYRELYELQRRRLEYQVLLVTQERDIWNSAAYDLALKIIDRNQLTLVRRLDVSGKALTKVLKHFIVLLASKDTSDLADLQEEAEKFREMLGRVGAEIEHLEESSKEKLQIVCRSLNKWLQYCDSNLSSQMNEGLLDEIIPDMKILINMLKEDVQQYGGEVYLVKTESLKSAARLQEHWTELGQTVLNRHRDFTGALPPQYAALEEINKSAHELYQQYNIRISGNNGTTTFLTALVRSMEDWLFKVQKLKKGSGMHEAELQAFYHRIPSWLAQVDAVMSCIGSGQLHEAKNDMEPHLPVVPREFSKMIQRWILSMNNEVEKSIMHLNDVTELHRNLTLWLVNLLQHVIADRLSCECPQQQESETETDKDLRLLSAHKLQDEAKELVAKMCRLSGSIVSCCREIVSEIVRKKRSEMDLEADFELEELNKIKTECCNWIQVCSLLLSEIKGTPVSFLDLEELRKLFGSEELQLKKLKDTTISEGLRADDANSYKKPITQEETLAVKEEIALTQQQPSAGADDLSEGDEATEDMIRYVGHDSNIHLKSLKSDIISVTGREMTASKSSTPFSQKEFEALAMLEHLQVQLLETEIRAQKAEERAEGFEKKLGEALEKIQELESELEKKEKCFQESVSEGEACSSPKASASGQSKGSRKSNH
ncbi:axonemal dynein light chain domain-containing protein 1 isoform X1 [Anas platyrhynchos]|uniref:axonemal dynein light chain domain-containing protein 1 isoform X1 n=1 Tax=Anas platyrhynchos TaxID=8839 RepID=UPI00065E8762|nr:axonemal dynein light chain domain-containing protein 1 [Anas platyrhynchos]|eukprot:XP_021127970.1 axonemal dynein light chain domain-containing protein 1 isoform X4 [Anas platyrhynchos]